MATEHVLGLGGVFWRARDAPVLAAWYETHFGIPADPGKAGPWMAGGGPLVFGPFPSDTDYFGGPQRFMANFRIADLDAFLADLARAGIKEAKPQEKADGIGRFAWIEDPEGNRIELWEPAADVPQG